MTWIRIFKIGTHTDSGGQTKTWTAGDLDRAVELFRPAEHEPPLVLGHPKTDDPAYGWIEGLRRSGQFLEAKVRDVAPELLKAVRQKMFKKVSVAFYEDGSLRHVGLLGAAAPAVKGLGDVSFVDAGKGAPSVYEADMTLTYSSGPGPDNGETRMDPTIVELQNKIKELESRLKELEGQLKEEQAKLAKTAEEKAASETAFAEYRKGRERKDRAARFEKLVADGKALPAEKVRVLAFAEALGRQGELEFAEEGGTRKESGEEAYWKSLEARPEHGLFVEQATAGRAAPTSKTPADASNINDYC